MRWKSLISSFVVVVAVRAGRWPLLLLWRSEKDLAGDCAFKWLPVCCVNCTIDQQPNYLYVVSYWVLSPWVWIWKKFGSLSSPFKSWGHTYISKSKSIVWNGWSAVYFIYVFLRRSKCNDMWPDKILCLIFKSWNDFKPPRASITKIEMRNQVRRF